MTEIEIITLSISSIALVMSLVTLYLTFFHKKESLIGMLVMSNYAVEGKFDNELEYSIGNTGNQELLLKEIETLVGRTSGGKKASSYSVQESECNEVPLIIEPGQIKLIKLRFMSDEIKKAKEGNENFYVSFTLISPQGKSYEILHDVTALTEFNTEMEKVVWKSFKLGKAND